MEVYEIYQKWIVLPGMTGILLILLLAFRIRQSGMKKEGMEREENRE